MRFKKRFKCQPFFLVFASFEQAVGGMEGLIKLSCDYAKDRMNDAKTLSSVSWSLEEQESKLYTHDDCQIGMIFHHSRTRAKRNDELKWKLKLWLNST